MCCIVSLAVRQKLHLLLLVTPISFSVTFAPIILCIVLMILFVCPFNFTCAKKESLFSTAGLLTGSNQAASVMICMKNVCCHVALPETFVTLSTRRLQACSAMEQETMNVMIYMKSVCCHVALPETFVTLSCQTPTGTQRHGAGDQE